MNSTHILSLPREAGGISKWILIVFAMGVLAFLGVPALQALRQGEPDVMLSLTLLPWLVGPAALAVLWVARARSRVEAWLFIGAEAAVIISTAWLWFSITFVKTGHANSEYALGLFILPLFEFAALLIYALGVIAAADLVFAKGQHHEKPRIALLIILSIACAVIFAALGWMFGWLPHVG